MINEGKNTTRNFKDSQETDSNHSGYVDAETGKEVARPDIHSHRGTPNELAEMSTRMSVRDRLRESGTNIHSPQTQNNRERVITDPNETQLNMGDKSSLSHVNKTADELSARIEEVKGSDVKGKFVYLQGMNEALDAVEKSFDNILEEEWLEYLQTQSTPRNQESNIYLFKQQIKRKLKQTISAWKEKLK